MKKEIKFRMLAYTDAAGKYTRGAVREGNEDNFYADDDLSDNVPSQCIADKIVSMSDCGLLMVVADGMGGQNAGEVASQIAVDTVREYFMPKQITKDLASTHENRRKYMESVIKEADARIKKEARHNVEHQGMGSTIIMAWIVGNKMTISWCGDSRAYRYNPKTGIELLSRDHSYVQELVNKGKISYEDTFEHPQGNIVTRSLGDESQKARPESREFDIYDSDIILLCSDGLSGVLRDKKTYDSNGNLLDGENIEDIIKDNHTTLTKCREALWTAAEKADWYDNVTVVLCEIISGIGKECSIKNSKKEDKAIANESFKGVTLRISNKTMLISFLTILVLCGIGIGSKRFIQSAKTQQQNVDPDTLREKLDKGNPEEYILLSTLKVKLDSLYRVVENQKIAYGARLSLDNLNVSDTTQLKKEINNVEALLILWQQKMPFINKINQLINQNQKDEQKVSAYKQLLKKIREAPHISKNEWDAELNRIGKLTINKDTKSIGTTQNENIDDGLSPIYEDCVEVTFTLRWNDDYIAVVKTLETNNNNGICTEIRIKDNSRTIITSDDDIRRYLKKGQSKQATALIRKK